MRFNRKYELIIGTGAVAVIITNPIRIVFDCAKSIVGGRNKLNVQIYNLKESNRYQLVKDIEQVKYIPLQLSVGYGDSIETIFKGSVHVGSNDRRGADMVSSIECLDGGYDTINSYTSAVVKGKSASIGAVVSDMQNTDIGKITSQTQLSRPKVIVSSSSDALDSMMAPGETWYIENEQLYIVKDSEVVSRYIPVISAETGLLNTPQRQNQKVSVETLMNPSLKIGGLVEVLSLTAPHLNAIYKIESMTYSGDVDGADWKQSISMLVAGNYGVI